MSLDPAVQAATQATLQTQIQVALLARQQGAVRQQGEAAVALLEQAAAISKAPGKGCQCDVTA